MRRRSLARWLAPLALLGSVAAIMLVISSSEGGSGDAATTSPGITGSTTTTTDATTTIPTSTGGRRFYTVKDGDVLSAIAEKTGVALEVIEQLNPKVDAQTLHAGQRIKLRP
jgi:LysM repeat protein